jgi:uncharacterized protein
VGLPESNLQAYMVMTEGSIPIPQDATTIVVSGASGVLGSSLRKALAARNAHVLQLVRKQAGAGQLTWNPSAASSFADTAPMEGALAAIHLSGSSIAGHRWSAAYKHELAASRVDSTRALATALARLQHPPRTLIVASAVGFYGNRGDELLTEASPPGRGFLPEVCRLWEDAARPAADAGIRVVHTRFGVVLNLGPGALEKMLPIFRLGLGGTLGDGRQWMSWVSLTDAIAAIQYALETPALAGPVNVTAPNPVTNEQFTRALARQLHRPALLPAPAFALRVAFGQMADEALLASARAIPAKLSRVGFEFTHPNVEEALAAVVG